MRAQITNTLEVFRYACIHQAHGVSWDKQAIQRIEHTLKAAPKLDRLHALVYQNAIKRQHLDWFSVETSQLLKKTTFALVADIAAKRAFIHRLKIVLEEHNIQVILLKGMAFNDFLYTGSAPRGTSDIDILIKPEDKNQFELLLKALAKPVEAKSEHPFDGLYEQSWVALTGANQFIDVHTYLTNPSLFNIDYHALWQTSNKHPEYHSESIRVMDEASTCVYLLTHMINDTNFYHYNLIDMHEVIANSKHNLNFDVLLTNWGATKAHYYVKQIAETNLFTVFNSCPHSRKTNLFLRLVSWCFINWVMVVKASDKSLLQRIKQLFTYLLFIDNTQNIVKVIKQYLHIRFS